MNCPAVHIFPNKTDSHLCIPEPKQILLFFQLFYYFNHDHAIVTNTQISSHSSAEIHDPVKNHSFQVLREIYIYKAHSWIVDYCTCSELPGQANWRSRGWTHCQVFRESSSRINNSPYVLLWKERAHPPSLSASTFFLLFSSGYSAMTYHSVVATVLLTSACTDDQQSMARNVAIAIIERIVSKKRLQLRAEYS